MGWLTNSHTYYVDWVLQPNTRGDHSYWRWHAYHKDEFRDHLIVIVEIPVIRYLNWNMPLFLEKIKCTMHSRLVKRLFRLTIKVTPKLHVTFVLWMESPVTGGFHLQRASNAKRVSLSWRNHGDSPSFRGFWWNITVLLDSTSTYLLILIRFMIINSVPKLTRSLHQLVYLFLMAVCMAYCRLSLVKLTWIMK